MDHKHGKISIEEWNLKTIDKLNEILSKSVFEAASEVIQAAFDNEDTTAHFPVIWGEDDGDGGPKPDDPLTVHFCVAEIGEDFDQVIWASSLGKMLEAPINSCAEDGSFSDGLLRIRDALLELAARIDRALPSNAQVQAGPAGVMAGIAPGTDS